MQQKLFNQEENTIPSEIIVRKRNAGSPLSKEQQTINRLVKRISSLQNVLKQNSEKLDVLTKVYHDQVIPVLLKLSSLKIEFCHMVHEKRQAIKLSNILNDKLDEMILDFLDDAFSVAEPDDDTKRLYKKYSGESYDDLAEEVEQNTKDFFCDMIYQEFGLEIDPAHITANPDYEKIKADLEEQMKRKSGGNQTSRKKTKKQKEKEEAEQLKEKLKTKTLRSIYLSLAKLLHPDREPDEELKREKEEMLKQVTTAYTNRDMMCLLQLEMKWLTTHENRLNDMDNRTLTAYVQLLKDQVKDLEAERDIFFLQPDYLSLSDFWSEDLGIAIHNVKEYASKYHLLNKSISDDIEAIKSSRRTYALIRDCIGKYYY